MRMITDELKLLIKLDKCKQVLWAMNLKKTGRNSFHHYSYYELEDITVPIHSVLRQQGLISNFKVSEDGSGLNLNIYDTETGYKDVTYCPFSEKEKAGMKGVQELQTYAKRTLFLLVFELQEPNVIEIENGSQKKEKNKKKKQNNTDKSEAIDKKINNIINKAVTTTRGKKLLVSSSNVYELIKTYDIDEETLQKVRIALEKREDIP